MNLLTFGVAAWLVVVSLVGIVLSRNLLRTVICLSTLQSGSYLLLLAVGYRHAGTAPVVPAGANPPGVYTDPVVQAMTLTDVVVSITITAMLAALAVLAHRHVGSLDPEDLREMRG